MQKHGTKYRRQSDESWPLELENRRQSVLWILLIVCFINLKSRPTPGSASFPGYTIPIHSSFEASCFHSQGRRCFGHVFFTEKNAGSHDGALSQTDRRQHIAIHASKYGHLVAVLLERLHDIRRQTTLIGAYPSIWRTKKVMVRNLWLAFDCQYSPEEPIFTYTLVGYWLRSPLLRCCEWTCYCWSLVLCSG